MTKAPRLVADGDQYVVHVDDHQVGTVYKARLATDRYRHGSPTLRGRTRWFASPGVDDDFFATRKEAVAELVRRWRNRQS